MLGMRTMFFAPSRISELVVSCFVSSILPRANRRLNLSRSVVGASTTTTGAFCSSFFLPNAKACLFLFRYTHDTALDTRGCLDFLACVFLQKFLPQESSKHFYELRPVHCDDCLGASLK